MNPLGCLSFRLDPCSCNCSQRQNPRYCPEKPLQPRPAYLRWIIHLLLAAFLANAANKFFVGDLEYEAEHHFYQRIFDFVGDAPDQYRILPLLPLKALSSQFSFNYSVLIYNTLLAFLVFEMLTLLMKGMGEMRKYLVLLLFSLLYIFFQYTGWRPDTMGLLAVCTAGLLMAEVTRADALRNALLLAAVAALGFCRADIALVYGLFFAVHYTRNWGIRAALVLVPLGVQATLQYVIFPEAVYYSDKVMLLDNLRLYYLLRHPATYLFLAAAMIWWRPLRDFFRLTFRKYLSVYLLLAGYILLVLVIGRLNEYRLYLPFLPIFLLMVRETTTSTTDEEGTDAV
jgi:hypothetical protein